MKTLAFLAITLIALYALRSFLRRHSTGERIEEEEPAIIYDPYLESPFVTLFERAA